VTLSLRLFAHSYLHCLFGATAFDIRSQLLQILTECSQSLGVVFWGEHGTDKEWVARR
jgi:hypothetical protein